MAHYDTFIAAGWCLDGGIESKLTTVDMFIIIKDHITQCDSVAH